MTRLLASLLALLIWLAPAYAGTGTITVLDAGGITRTFDIVTDGSGHYIGESVICDQSAAANCATVDTNHNLNVGQATAANLNATVVGTGTFAVQATLQAAATTAIGKVDPNTIASWGLMSGTTPGTAPTNTLIAGGIYNSSAPTATTGQTLPLQTDASGNLNVNIKAGAGSGGTALADQATFTQSTTSETPIGCLYITSYSAGTTGKSTVVQCDSTGHLLTNPGTIGNWGLVVSTQNSTTPTNGGLVEGQFNTTPTTITSGNVSPLQMDSAGNLLVNIKAGAGSGGTALADGATFTIGTTSETPAACTFVTGGITITTGKSSILTCNAAGSLNTNVVTSTPEGAVSDTAWVSGNGSLIAIAKAIAGGVTGSVPAGSNTIGAVTQASGPWTVMLPTTPTIAAGNGVVLAPSTASAAALSHASVTSLGTSLVVKSSAGNLYGFNCTAITGGAAGYCVAYNGTSSPGSPTAANVLDVCYFGTTAAGCSLSRIPIGVNYSTGIVIYMTSAASPFTNTTGTDTGYISADYD